MMRVPDEFINILKMNDKLYTSVMKTVYDFSDIIQNSQFEFFPEYTDHKIDHLNRVLETAHYLTKDSGLDLLTPEDICTLILSTLLHDIGMHVTHEGFLSLIEDEYEGNNIQGFDNYSWNELWQQYIKELKRLNGTSLINIFGQEFEVKEPPRNKDYLTRLDRKVIGEFIRRHHPRLAHEITLFGFPTKKNEVIKFGVDLEEGLRDIIGVVARSHGLDIRKTFEYLESKFDKAWRNPRNVKCIYHMVILRVSDYLHITSERAPKVYLNTNNISSTVSRLEWDLHKSINEINYDMPDRESLFIIADPSDSLKYIKLKQRFKDIQYEIDTSWAIMGEVYNFMENYKTLGIKIRRIQSNLDNVEKFSDSVSYLPKEVRCDSSPELIKLLIAPLYGHNPSFGVRELLQNSIDACKERQIYEEKAQNSYRPLITIEIYTENEVKYIKIKDNGIGMNEDVIVNYFLKAGASFRDSYYWRSHFIQENGKSIVQRNGRFGVGVFAGFLIGEKIKVRTSHTNGEITYEFEVNLSQEQIEVNVSKLKKEIGTEIIIELSDTIYQTLENQLKSESRYDEYPAWFDWYKLSDIKIEISIPKEWEIYEYKIENLKFIEQDDVNQRSLLIEDFNEIRWTYNNILNSTRHNLICNGIIIPKGYNLKGFDFPKFTASLPLVIVTDYDGNLPLTLDRDRIYGDLPFKEKLIEDICKDILAQHLLLPSLEFDSYGSFKIINSILSNDSLEKGSYAFRVIEESELLFLKDGSCLVHSYNIDKLGLKKINKIWINNLEDNFINNENQLNGIIFSDRIPSAITDFKNVLENKYLSLDKHYEIKGKRIVIQKDRYKYLFDKDRLKNSFKKEVEVKRIGNNVICLETGETDRDNYDFEMFDHNFDKFGLYCEYFIGDKVDRKVVEQNRHNQDELIDIFSGVLKEILDDKVLIPYDLQNRQNLHSKGIEILSKYFPRYNDKVKDIFKN